MAAPTILHLPTLLDNFPPLFISVPAALHFAIVLETIIHYSLRILPNVTLYIQRRTSEER